MGTALKTLSLRLRGAKTELEEASLDVEGMAENTSTLQAKLKALTHGKVDIMLDADTFKSTTQILREMSEAWEDMTDIERASALELMGGKRQSNILSSVITNFETVEDVIETSMKSSGSAIAENEKWLDSIEGKTYQFTNALQTMWSNMLDSEVIKGFLDFGTEAIQFLDTGAGKAVALVAALKLMAKFKGFSIKGIAQGLGSTIQNITKAQQTLQALSSVSPVTGPLPTESINAYAAAVAGLTAKQQANLLASQNLTKQDIQRVLQTNQCTEAEQREAMAHVHTGATKEQEAAASQALFVAQTQELAMSYQNAAADLTEADAEQAKLAAKILSEAASENLTRAELLEKIMQSSLTEETKEQIIAKLGLTTANQGLLASIKALMVANPVGFWITVGTTILSLIPMISNLVDEFTKSAEEIKQEAKEISQAYEDTVNEVNNNLQSLGITNDSASIGSLEKEFATLTAGVDKYGNNLSLTSDQYERYRDICEQIVGINPRLARGYDSATEAIGNNASVLSQLIELQKEQARIAAEQYFSDDNIETLTKDAVNNYNDASLKNSQKRADALRKVSAAIGESFQEYYNNNPDLLNDGMGINYHEMKWTLEQIGYSAEDAAKKLQEYYTAGEYSTSLFYNDFIDEIQNNVSSFGTEYTSSISKSILEAKSEFTAAEKELLKARDGLIDTLLVAPVSSKDYGKLTSDGKNFLVEWIKNSEMFKIDDATLEPEQVKAMQETILNMMDILVSDAKNIEYNGEKFTAQELLSKIYNLDPSSVNYDEYKKQVNEMLTALWNILSDEQKKEYGFEKFEDFTISLGFNFVADKKSETDMIKGYARAKKISEEDARAYFNSLPAEVVQRLLEVKWDLVDENNVDETIKNAKGNQSSMLSSKTYSILTESAEAYNDILTKTSEIAADNTEVTQEYKDSLVDLGVSQEELNECFDDTNPLVVKNAKALNKLVKEANKNVAANVKLAKSNARLEYYDLVKQLSSALDGTKELNAETRDSVYSTLEQIDAVQEAIYKYQLLEDTLLGVNNAFKEFNDAKEIDELNTYGDSYVEMVQTMYDGLFKTGQVGTEQFWAAVEHLIPDEVYQGLKEDSDRMKAIYDYYNKNILPSLHLEDDQFSMDYASIENFVNDALNTGVFTGDGKDFDLVEGMNLERAAELMGMTKTQAYAFFAELDKYNTSSTEPSFLAQLDDSLEGQITNITNKLEDLNKQKISLLEDGDYDESELTKINNQIAQQEKELDKLGQKAYNTWQEYTKNEAVIAALGEIEDKQRKLTEEEANKLGLEWDEVKDQTVQQAYDTLLTKQLQLEEPTVLTAQLAIEDIDTQINTLKGKIEEINNDHSISPKIKELKTADLEAQIQKLEEDKVVIATTFGIELSEDDKKGLEKELNTIEKFTINDKEFTVIANGTSEVMQLLNDINNYVLGTKTQTIRYKVIGDTGTVHTPGAGGRYTMADGTAHVNGFAYKNGSFGVQKTETALVGELGPEMLVRNGRWTTVGDNGAEFTQVKKGDIIFNHKQTEDLLSKGYVTGRGKLNGGAFASGTAYSGLWRPTSKNTSQSNKPGHDFSLKGDALYDAADALSDAAANISNSSDEFKEVFDWIEVRLEEINKEISMNSAKLENQVGYKDQNKVVEDMIDLNKKLYTNLTAGAARYYSHAEKLLAKVPEEYRTAAQDGTIAIESFVGEVSEETLNAIQEYREWVQKGDDATQQAEETLTEIANLAAQAIKNIGQEYDNKKSIKDSEMDQLDAYNEYSEAKYGTESKAIYEQKIKINEGNIGTLTSKRDGMQAKLNEKVESGEIEKYSQAWYDAVNEIAAVDTEIINLQTDTEKCKDAITDIHWEHFDNGISRIQSVSKEADNLLDILSNKDMVDDSGNWTDEGITSLGLYAQKMEAAEAESRAYQEAIDDLNANWQEMGYTEQEYLEKLDELKDGQYDAVKTYEDSKKAIVDLNKERVNAIKDGIDKEIDAYKDLTDAKKEELDAEKDLHDFQKSVMDQEKDIADIKRQLAALAGDNSAAARAKRAQLEAELAEAESDLEETYYDRSINNQKEALDKEAENFEDAKEKEKETLDESIKDTEKVVEDTYKNVQGNTETVSKTISDTADKFGLDVSNTLTEPWEDGSAALQEYSEKFGDSTSSTTEAIEGMVDDYNNSVNSTEDFGSSKIKEIEENFKKYQTAAKKEETKEASSTSSENEANKTPEIKVGGNIDAGSAKIYDYVGAKAESQYYSKDPKYTVLAIDGDWVQVRHNSLKSGVTGWFKKSDVKAYAKGSKGVDEDQWALIDELGEELVLRAQGGRLTYLEKGSGVVPADLTSNLMEWGKLDPSIMLDQNRPQVGVHPEVSNTQIQIDNSIAELIHIDKCDQGTLPDVQKIVDKALDKHMQKLNQSLRKYTR